MARGKQTCKILKEIRKQIAAENDIEFVTSECTHKGDCKGTCPKCEAEVRYLERELEKRQRMGKAAVFAGMTIGTAITAAACGPLIQPTAGMPVEPDDTVMAADSNRTNFIPDDVYMLEGDVMVDELDTMKVTCKIEEPLTIPGNIVEIEDEGVIEGEIPAITTGEVEGESDVYQIVEQMPEFPGGQEALFQYIAEHVNYPVEAKKAGAYGRVFVGFVVEPDGSLSDVKVLRSIGFGCDEEAVRVVESMPKWKPGTHRDEAVRVRYFVPVIFKLD